jgi:hypothetical protein
LADEGPKGVPRNLLRVNVGAILSDGVYPFINTVDGAALITFVEFVNLRPANRGVAEAFLNDSVEPRYYEMQACSFNRHPI